MAQLFSPLQLREVSFKNRIAVSPMCQYSSEDGFANDWHLVHLGSRAVGGAALVIAEATAVSPEGRISPHDLGIWKDEHIPGLKRITSFIEQQQSVAGVQLGHAGRKASHSRPWEGGLFIPPGTIGWPTVAPSPLPFVSGNPAPEALDVAGIDRVVADFRAAAQRALQAGFKVIEIHAAHGYLIHQFLSPLSNVREDEYGGSFENRARLMLRITDAIREVWPAELPLFVRISATDWVDDGWHVPDSIRLTDLLQDHGVDLIDCSSGGVVPGVKIPLGPGYQVPFAEAIRSRAGIATAAVGLISNAEQAERIIQSGQADLVLLGREMLRDPYFAFHAALELDEQNDWPIQYERARPKRANV